MTRVAGAWVVVVGLAACGATSHPPPPPGNQGPPAAELDAPCFAAGDHVTVADGAFHCRELPMAIEFPAGATLSRVDTDTIAMFTDGRDRGILAVVVVPSANPTSAAELDKLLDAMISGFVADSVRTAIDIAPLHGATVARGLTFTTPDGGAGEMRGYYAYDWIVAVIAGGRRVDDPARPDHPVGKAFLASLQLRPLPPGRVPLALVDGATIEIPASSWPAAPPGGEDATRLSKWYIVPDRGVAIAVRVVDARDTCNRIRLATDAELGPLIDAVFLTDLTSTKVTHVDNGAYFEVAEPDRAMVSRVVCKDPLLVQVIVMGAKTVPLQAVVDELAGTVVVPGAS
jgi:hypothetical protein